MGPTSPLNPGRLGAAAQRSWLPSSSGSQIVHKAPLPSDSTNCAMTVSTSGNGDPAMINLRMLSTDSMEESADPLCSVSTFGRTGAGDCLADFIFNTAALERSLGNHNGDQIAGE